MRLSAAYFKNRRCPFSIQTLDLKTHFILFSFLFLNKHKNVWVLNTCEPVLSGNPRLVIHCCEFGDTGAARGALLCGNWDANVYHWLGLVPSRCTRERAQERGVRNTEPQRECGLCLFLTQTQLMQDLCILPCPSTFSSAV